MNNTNNTFIAPSLTEDQVALWTWIPLFFSLFYFLPIFYNWQHFDIIKLSGSALIYLCFVYFYMKAQRQHDERTAIRPILAILLLSCIGTYFNPGTFTLFAFAAYFIGYYYPTPKSIVGLALTIGLIVLTAFAFELTDMFFITPALFCSVPNFMFGLAERRSRMQKLNEQRSQQQIEQLATVAERERIARDLHDLLGHTLSSIALKAELAEKLAKAGHAAQSIDEISQVAKITRETLSEVRQAVSGYKAKDPQAEVDKIVARLADKDFTFEQEVSLDNLTAKAESSLILILKEAITNILRHSNGDHVIVKTQQNEDSLLLTIFDNGSHYSVKNKEPLFSNGLKGIVERVSELKGKFSINTEQGFELTINLPTEVFISEK
ncbi:MAG: sensor histidine kinase [Colwellia sp.]|nr:sensor histidine kinase [Colwellia sp.]